MASVRIGRTDASSAVEGSREELVRRGLTLKDLGVDAAKHGFVLAISDGAELVYGGNRPDAPELRQGWFFTPTIFDGVRNDMDLAQEEVFGPVLGVLTFHEEEELIALANQTRYGLAAGIWTNDIKRAHRVARDLKAGTVWINAYRGISYASPFGGY